MGCSLLGQVTPPSEPSVSATWVDCLQGHMMGEQLTQPAIGSRYRGWHCRLTHSICLNDIANGYATETCRASLVRDFSKADCMA